MAKITIDGKQLEVPDGVNVLQAALSNGIHLEHFCYHSYLPVAGNCRTCMIEIDTPRKIMGHKVPMVTIACNTRVSDGMVVRIQGPKARQYQKSPLEMLLLDHPLDCPICDKSGECRLQDQYMTDGLYDYRRGVPHYFKDGKALDIGEHIVLDQERCILCTRCIRFLDEIPKTSELGIVNRGHESKITPYPGVRLDNLYSGNVSDVCPVGALTLKEFRFKQRVWLLRKTESICPGCARGCNITVEQNRDRIYRFMPRENAEVNKTWICDEGRFSFNHYQENRLTEARLGHAVKDLKQGIDQLAEILSGLDSEDVAGIASPWASLEDNYILRKLFEKRFNILNLSAPLWAKKGSSDNILRLADKFPNEQGLRLLGIPAGNKDFWDKMEKGAFKAVIVMDQDPFGQDGVMAEKSYRKVKALIVLSTHKTKTVERAGMAFPVKTFTEKSGTFVNATSRLQRFKQAIRLLHIPAPFGGGFDGTEGHFPTGAAGEGVKTEKSRLENEPAFEPEDPDIVESSLWLCRLAQGLQVEGFGFEDTPSIFNAMAKEIGVLKGLTFYSIPPTGTVLNLPPLSPEPFQGIRANPNVLGGKLSGNLET